LLIFLMCTFFIHLCIKTVYKKIYKRNRMKVKQLTMHSYVIYFPFALWV
jgi:hypothetical protein